MSLSTDQDLQAWLETYLAAMAIYAIIRTSGIAQVRRAQLRQGEVKAEPIDFVCDIETRAKENLEDHNELLLWWDVLEDPDRYADLPQSLRWALGKAFLQHDLGVEGHYRQLYFRLKNQNDRRIKESKNGSQE